MTSDEALRQFVTEDDLADWLHDFDFGPDHDPTFKEMREYRVMARTLLKDFAISRRGPANE